MTIPILLILAGLLLLFVGGEGLVRGASALALRLGLTPLIVGLTVVAFGTSAPELVVSLKASIAGLGNIALGNVVGSNIFNIAFILGITAMVCPINIEKQVLRRDAPLMLAVSLLLVWMLRDRTIDRMEGAILFTGILLYTALSVILAKKSRPAPEAVAVVPPTHPVWHDVAFLIGGFAALVFGSRWLVDGATVIAKSFGVSDAIIGLTIVSAGTSLPELSASLIAAFRKQPDIAIGNIVGSNIFNILCIAGAGGLAKDMVARDITIFDLGVMIALSALIIPLMRTGWTLGRWEGGLLFLSYLGYMFWLWPK